MNNYYKPGGFGGFSFFPPVIKNLLIINAVIFLVTWLGNSVVIESQGMSLAAVVTKYFALIPYSGLVDVNRLGVVVDKWSFYPWQLITYQFLHGDFSHIFFNMFALWMFGMELENIWGSKKFLIFYLICGVAAGIAHLFLTPILTNSLAPTIGASGSIFGVMVAFAMMFPDRYIYIYFLIPVKAKYLIAFLVILEFGFVNSAAGGNIAHLAHLGGAVAGFIYVLIDKNNVSFSSLFRRKPKSIYNNYTNYGNPSYTQRKSDIEDAKFSEDKESTDINQEEIDKILDKISQSGYQKLTDKEKRILFEASKKLNKDK